MSRLQTRDQRLQTTDQRPETADKRLVLIIFAFCLLSLVSSLMSPVCFAEMSFEDAEEKAAEAHKLAASDVIYQEQDWKALYFQNVQIISLLKDIKEEMEKFNAREITKEEK